MDRSVTEKYKNWAICYKKNLGILQADLRLIEENSFDIYIAIDFHDLIQYCFPLISLLEDEVDLLLDNKKKRKHYMKNQIARSAIYLLSSKVYDHPILLLPPYIRENNDFFNKMKKEFLNYVKAESQRTLFRSITEEFCSDFKAANDTDEIDRIINSLGRKGSDLAFIFSRSIPSGMDIFSYITKNHLSYDPTFMIKNLSLNNDFLIKKYYEIENIIKNGGNLEIENMLEDTRDIGNKKIQNMRDAAAIKYIYELNDILNKHNKAIFLISSAAHMKNLMNTNVDKLKLARGGEDIQILRDLDYVYILLQEISKHLRHQAGNPKSNSRISSSELKALLRSVNEDIIKLDKFLIYFLDSNTIAGVLQEEIANQNLNEIIKLNEEISNIDISLLVNNYLPEGDMANNIKNMLDLDSTIKEFTRFCTSLHEAIKSDKFNDKLAQINAELESKRINFLWSMDQGNLPTIYEHLAYEIIEDLKKSN